MRAPATESDQVWQRRAGMAPETQPESFGFSMTGSRHNGAGSSDELRGRNIVNRPLCGRTLPVMNTTKTYCAPYVISSKTKLVKRGRAKYSGRFCTGYQQTVCAVWKSNRANAAISMEAFSCRYCVITVGLLFDSFCFLKYTCRGLSSYTHNRRPQTWPARAGRSDGYITSQ